MTRALKLTELRPYADAGMRMFPLRKWDSKDKAGKAAGKMPRDKGYKDREYSKSEIVEAARNGYNIGILLQDTDLVLDIDPRSGGDKSLEQLRTDLPDVAEALDKAPIVESASGGLHFYLTKRSDVKLAKSLKDAGYPGIDLKREGGHVVAAGSIHPSGKLYLWDKFSPPLVARPEIPDTFYAIASIDAGEGAVAFVRGLLDPEELGLLLKFLDPKAYRTNETWEPLMMACHHATGGHGLGEFTDWCTGDPQYADFAGDIEKRWHSLNAIKPGAELVTAATLLRELREAGAGPEIGRILTAKSFEQMMPADEFDSTDPQPGTARRKYKKQVVDCALAITQYGVTVRYNELAGAAEADVKREGFVLLTDEIAARLRLEMNWGYGIDFGKQLVADALEAMAYRNRYHPVRSWLSELTWDGTSRIDGAMAAYFGALDDAWAKEVGRILFLGAVARARDPGCKYDFMVILEGPQRSGKSTALATLARRNEWFNDNLRATMDTKQLMECTAGAWIVEMQELEGLSLADHAHLKAMISRRADKARMAWGRIAEIRPRQWIAVGTTNEYDYLRDHTGNTRFLPIGTSQIDLRGLARDADQLWAEADSRYGIGERPMLDADYYQRASEEQELRQEDDPWKGTLMKLPGLPLPNKPGWRFITTDMALDAIGMTQDRRTSGTGQRVFNVLAELGWERGREYIDNVRRRVMLRLDPALDVPDEPDHGIDPFAP